MTDRPSLLYGLAYALLVFSGIAQAELSSYAGSNKQLYATPRAKSLGGSDRSFARDGSPTSNPGSLVLDSISEVGIGYASLYGNAAGYSTAWSVASISSHDAVALSLSYLLIPNIEITAGWPLDNNGNPIVPPESEWQRESASEALFGVSFAHQFLTIHGIDIAGGAACEAFRKRLPLVDGFLTGYGIGLDAGVIARFRSTGFRAGLNIENLTTTYVHWNRSYSENELAHIRLGLGWEKDLPYVYGRLRATYSSLDLLANEGVNVQKPGGTFGDSATIPLRLHLSKDPEFLLYGSYGLEYLIAQRLALRVGLRNGLLWSFGGGLNVWNQRLALDFSYETHELGGTPSLALSYRW